LEEAVEVDRHGLQRLDHVTRRGVVAVLRRLRRWSLAAFIALPLFGGGEPRSYVPIPFSIDSIDRRLLYFRAAAHEAVGEPKPAARLDGRIGRRMMAGALRQMRLRSRGYAELRCRRHREIRRRALLARWRVQRRGRLDRRRRRAAHIERLQFVKSLRHTG